MLKILAIHGCHSCHLLLGHYDGTPYVYDNKKQNKDQNMTTTGSGTKALKLTVPEPIKALHSKISKANPPAFKAYINALYSSSATTFPLASRCSLFVIINFLQMFE